MAELTAYTVLLAILTAYTISRVQKLFRGIRATGHLRGFRIPFQPYAFPGGMFPTSWWNPGLEATWYWRHTLYKRFNNDTISAVPFLLGIPSIFTSNLDVARQIKFGGPGKSGFGKIGMDASGPMAYWGPNLLLSDGDSWRKHRRIVGPAFNQKLYELVWTQSLSLYMQMLKHENPTNASEFTAELVQNITFKFAFYIIGICGFDFPFNWDEAKSGEGSKFAEAMRFFVDNIQLLHLPEGVRGLPTATFKQMNTSIVEIEKFMNSKIAEKEEQVKNGNSSSLGNDIFSMLVQANQAEKDAKLKLDYQELISDVFLMLFAGHETTAHTLAAAIACLARYPDQQQEVVEQIMNVVGDREPTIDDYSNLNKVQAAFYEALRMFPTAYVTMREAKEDTFLNVPVSIDSEECKAVPVAKGTQMVIDMIGIHRNERYFPDPDSYKISRWDGISNESEAIPGFGFGPRACIGRKFALTEAVCFLTMLLRDFKIEPLLAKGEHVDDWFKGVQKCHALIAMGVGNVGVRFVKRQ